MKAVQLIRPGLPLQMHEVPRPEPGPHDVLIRVRAAGICHSDAHYRAGVSPVRPLPLTLGHEVAGIVQEVGSAVSKFAPGDHVCLHYMVTCGHCVYCHDQTEQFCTTGEMIGKYRPGGYAEFISVPERSVFKLPREIPFEVGAILMCSSATSLHALVKTRLRPGETVAIFGVGGLGLSAVQLAFALGAQKVFAVDIKPAKLELAAQYGAIPVHALEGDPVEAIRRQTGGRGVDVALELIGLPLTMRQSVQSLAILGRAGLVGLTDKTFEINPYQEVLNREAEIIGVSDHLATEIPQLLAFVQNGQLRLADVIKTVPLDADAINGVLDRLEHFTDDVRTVIIPT